MRISPVAEADPRNSPSISTRGSPATHTRVRIGARIRVRTGVRIRVRVGVRMEESVHAPYLLRTYSWTLFLTPDLTYTYSPILAYYLYLRRG